MPLYAYPYIILLLIVQMPVQYFALKNWHVSLTRDSYISDYIALKFKA